MLQTLDASFVHSELITRMHMDTNCENMISVRQQLRCLTLPKGISAQSPYNVFFSN